jgi:hypothetical protein
MRIAILIPFVFFNIFLSIFNSTHFFQASTATHGAGMEKNAFEHVPPLIIWLLLKWFKKRVR